MIVCGVVQTVRGRKALCTTAMIVALFITHLFTYLLLGCRPVHAVLAAVLRRRGNDATSQSRQTCSLHQHTGGRVQGALSDAAGQQSG